VSGEINVEAKLYAEDETVAQEITLDTEGRSTLEVFALADAATIIRLDVSVDGSTWIVNFHSWAGVTIVKEGYLNAYRFVRLKSDAAGAAGDKVTLMLTAGGG
jgi:hypothetical protein